MIHVFDLDHTFIRGNVSFLFGKELNRNGSLPTGRLLSMIFAYTLHKTGFLSVKSLHFSCFNTFFKGYSPDLKVIDPFLDTLLLNPSVYARFESAKKSGEKTYLLSASPDFLVKPFAEKLGFYECGATLYKVDKDQRICDIATIMDGAAKLDYLKSLSIPLDKVVYYTDHIIDLAVCEAVGKVTVVNPKSDMRKKAIESRWEILDESAISGDCRLTKRKT
ncbi:MAG: HAD family hydrolase [Parachlamydiaceae bacterium]